MRCLFPLLLLAVATTSASHAQTPTGGGVIRLASATRVSDGFQHETEAATKSIPLHVWKTLLDAGWQVKLAEFVVDAAPSLRGVRPPGWPRHLTWDNSDAVHLPTHRLLVIAEKRRNRVGEIVASSRVSDVLRHEIGHAYDMAAGNGSRHVSATAEFIRIYQHDTNRIQSADKSKLSYYLQSGSIGRQEAFAEAFAVALGGGSSDIEAVEFERSFPNVMAYARQAISEPDLTKPTSAPTRISTQPTYRRRLLRRR